MPEVDYAFLCDYVRAEGGIAHVIAAGIDTVYHAEVPAGNNLGLLIRATFTRNECGRDHKIELIFQDEDGERLTQLQASVRPEWPAEHPVGWPIGFLLGVNMGLPIPRFGFYSLEVLINDNSAKSIRLRAVHRPAQ